MGDVQAAAQARVEKRCQEIVETESGMCASILALTDKLEEVQQDKSWKLGPEHLKLIDRTRDRVKMLHTIHTELSEKLFMFGGGPSHMADIFEGLEQTMVTNHAEFQTLSSCVIVVLQRKSGGQVIGDRAVGSSPKTEGSLAAALAELQDLLVRPTQRVMKYQLFLEEMSHDGTICGGDVVESAGRALEVVKRIASAINERIRGIQVTLYPGADLIALRRERVALIASRVRAVPPDVRLVREGREFLLDDGKFREFGRAGYRHLYLFSDCLLVCKPGESQFGRLGRTMLMSTAARGRFMNKGEDLKFKRLIPLRSIKLTAVPELREPPAPELGEAASPGSVTTQPYFELMDGGERCAFHGSREAVEEWVGAIRAALDRLPEIEPTPAYRLPTDADEMASLSASLADYVVIDHKDEEPSVPLYSF